MVRHQMKNFNIPRYMANVKNMLYALAGFLGLCSVVIKQVQAESRLCPLIL